MRVLKISLGAPILGSDEKVCIRDELRFGGSVLAVRFGDLIWSSHTKTESPERNVESRQNGPIKTESPKWSHQKKPLKWKVESHQSGVT